MKGTIYAYGHKKYGINHSVPVLEHDDVRLRQLDYNYNRVNPVYQLLLRDGVRDEDGDETGERRYIYGAELRVADDQIHIKGFVPAIAEDGMPDYTSCQMQEWVLTW